MNQGLIDQIDVSTDDDATKTIKKNLVKAEAFVPTALVYTTKELDPTDKTKHIGGALDGPATVSNSIDQSGPSAYHVGGETAATPTKINIENDEIISDKLSISIDIAETIVDERLVNGNYIKRI